VKKEPKIRILIADDHFVVRMGLIALVNTEPDMKVVAEAHDGAQAVELFDKFNPDLVLMDMRMPIKDGIWATIEIVKRFAKARVLMLTTYDGDDDIHRALQAGAHGYVLKNSAGEQLIPAQRGGAAGEQKIPKEEAHRSAAQQLF